ncbi:hypothetical protein E3N88_23822 [Mikania micrantha]|uniref:Uncharacterized protein n=1 Tax=Mikania micrantha TaxID=192012 RepID=A0A5N6NEC6_9ASTR|nr:hypothetical protein E3N88_23822 [Mikania micrantha]
MQGKTNDGIEFDDKNEKLMKVHSEIRNYRLQISELLEGADRPVEAADRRMWGLGAVQTADRRCVACVSVGPRLEGADRLFAGVVDRSAEASSFSFGLWALGNESKEN